jgi:hypothetical protein
VVKKVLELIFVVAWGRKNVWCLRHSNNAFHLIPCRSYVKSSQSHTKENISCSSDVNHFR